MDGSIFKAYDIRGTSPGQIDEVVARRLGKVLAAIYHPKTVLVGRDMRVTSAALEQALVDGLCASGAAVVRIGLCSTPVFNVTVGAAGGAYDLGVMVTASHNPAIYNGFKLVHGDCLPIGQGSGMEEIRARMCSEEPMIDSATRGSITDDDQAIARYVERVAALAEATGLDEGSVVIDAGNGMDGIVLPKVMQRLRPLEVYPLYWDLDGNFPHHEANPLKAETLEDLRAEMHKRRALFGVAFDGDADRVGFLDEEGVQIPGDLLTALFAQEVLKHHPGATVLYDLRSSWSVPEAIRAAGGRPLMCRVGHAHIKRQMRETGAVFAGELSMHFYFSDLWNVESGDYALLLLAKMLAREKKPLSQLWRPLKKYAHSGELNFSVKDGQGVIVELERRFAAQTTDTSHLDGLRLEFRSADHPQEDWWFNVRPSNTEPLLRLTMEGKTQETMEQHKQQLIDIIAL